MSRTARPADLGVVVAELNAARSALRFRGRPLTKIPKGERYDQSFCPVAEALGGQYNVENENLCVQDEDVARAIGHAWGKRPAQVRGNSWRVPLPDEVARFVKQFDAGQFPELTNTNGNG